MASPLTSSDDCATGRGIEGSATTNSLGPGGRSGPYFISSGILEGPSSLTSPTGTITVEEAGSPEVGVGSEVLPSPETTNAVGDAGELGIGVGFGNLIPESGDVGVVGVTGTISGVDAGVMTAGSGCGSGVTVAAGAAAGDADSGLVGGSH